LSIPEETIQDDAAGRITVRRKPVASWARSPVELAADDRNLARHCRRCGRLHVVIKPSPYTPLSTLRLIELMNGVLPRRRQFVTATAKSAAAMSSIRHRQDRVHGLIKTGKSVMSGASARSSA